MYIDFISSSERRHFFAHVDTSGWNSSIQTNLSMGLFQFPVEWNHLQTYLIVVLLQSIGIVFVSSFTLLISSFAKITYNFTFLFHWGMFFTPQLLFADIQKRKY